MINSSSISPLLMNGFRGNAYMRGGKIINKKNKENINMPKLNMPKQHKIDTQTKKDKECCEQKFACGGVAKIRKGEANANGTPKVLKKTPSMK